MKRRTGIFKNGFTLIELLIVVAIIAILAAIAVPNFLEAQTRAKVTRCSADMRTLRLCIESYRVDHNHYPETDLGEEDVRNDGVGMFRLTTPVAYCTSIPKSPFKEENMGNSGPTDLKNANKMGIYLYVRKRISQVSPAKTRDDNNDKYDDNYQTDRAAYLAYNVIAVNLAVRSEGEWMLKSVGPDNIDDRDPSQGGYGANARVYDPTNGTVSRGDVIVFSDRSGMASRND